MIIWAKLLVFRHSIDARVFLPQLPDTKTFSCSFGIGMGNNFTMTLRVPNP